MIIRKKMNNGKRSASAWNQDVVTGVSFGVTDYNPCLGYIDSDDNGNVTLYIYKDRCDEADVKIKYI